MRIIISLLLSCFTGYLTSHAQGVCSKYYPMEEGTSFQLTSYNSKDKIMSIVNYLVSETSAIPGGQQSTILTEIMNNKEEITATSEYDIVCENDLVSVDFKSLMGPDMYSQFPDMDMEVSGTALQLPNNLSEGQSLPDADMLAVINITPMKMRLTFIMTNRKVVGKESITTTAGTFECVVLSYDYESKFGVKVTGTAKQWLAEGVGLVKQEDYNKKGKLVNKTVLTKFDS